MANQIRLSNGPLPQAANTTITGSIAASGGGTVTVASAANLPTSGPFLVVVDNERIEIDSISGTTLTFLSGGRGQEGTSAAAHSSSANVYQVLSAAGLFRAVDDRTGVVLAPDPTGTAATDKSNLDALTATANRVVQLRPGTYVVNPLADMAAGVVLKGWPNYATTLKLAVQTNQQLVQIGAGGAIEDVIVDGDRANQTTVWSAFQGMVFLSTGARVSRCRLQNCKSTFLITSGAQQIETPQITALTTSTSGGSLATGVQHWYRVTATNATGETQASAEATVTTGAGSTNSNTVRWRQITGATGYKVYHATGATQWTELLLTTIGAGTTLVYVHTTGSGVTTAVPMENTTAAFLEDQEITDNTFANGAFEGVRLDYGNCRRLTIARNKATLLTQNFAKIKGSPIGGFSFASDVRIIDNTLDYSGMSISSIQCLPIEVWNRVYRCYIARNTVIGPRDDSTALFIPLSVGGDNDETVIEGNVVRKSNPNGANNLAEYCLEVRASRGCTVVGNTFSGGKQGIAVGKVDFNAGSCDQVTVIGNTIRDCFDYGMQVTEGSGHTIQGNTFIDCGRRYLFLNGVLKQTLANAIIGNTFFVASNDRSAANSGRLDAIFITDSGRQSVAGNVCGPLPALTVPVAPTVTPQGTTGATTYTYKVTAVNEYGETTGSADGTTTTGNATLTGSNFNRITLSALVQSTVGYRIYRTASGGTPSSLGYIGYAAGTAPSFDDTGIAADTNLVAPGTNTTGGTCVVGLTGIYFQGTALIEASVVNGNRLDGQPPQGSTKPGYAIIFDGQIDNTQVVNNFAANYATGFLQQTGTVASNPNYVQFNVAPGIPLPHVATPKFHDIVRRSDEVQRLGGGVYLADDFTGGLTTTGNIGDLGWQFLAAVGTGTVAHQAAVASHSGIIRLDSSATINSRFYVWVGASATTGQILPADWFHMTVMLRMNQASDANTVLRVGLGNSANADPGADGIFIEKLLADSSYFGLNRASSTSSTRTSALASVTNAQWIKMVIRRVSASATGFSVSTSFAPDAGTEATVSTNIPTTALVPYVMIGNSAAASKTVDIDYIEVNVNSMTR